MGPTSALVPKKKTSVSDYTQLRSKIRAAINAGKLRAQDAVEAEKVRTCWEVGKLIHEHILLNKDRADYGKKVVERLSVDIGISVTEIQYLVQFAKAYPISPHAGKLPWSIHRDLLSINDDEKRKALTEQAVREKWNRQILRREIKKIQSIDPKAINAGPNEELLIPIKGTLDTYRIVKLPSSAGETSGEPQIDLGFSNYLELTERDKKRFKEGDVVEVVGNTLKKSKRAEADLFTYRVKTIEITDADTLWMLVDLGFGFTTKQHLRLRGIDAPEIATRDGQAAKRFMERELKKASNITIASTKSDKYDRYLADIFYTKAGKEYFLNNELLKRGLATRVD